MAVDRGGLRYEIDVANSSAAAIKQFRDDIRAAKADWAAFKAKLQESGDSTAAAGAATAAAGTAARAASTAAIAYSTALVRVAQSTAIQVRQTGALVAVTTEQTQATLNLTGRTLQLALAARAASSAIQQQTRATQQLAAAQARLAGGSGGGGGGIPTINLPNSPRALPSGSGGGGIPPGGGGVPPGSPPPVGPWQNFFNVLNQTDGAGNRVAFTFRRLFGILAAFTIAREAVKLFRDLVSESVNLNAQNEQTTLGIAGLIAASGSIRDAQGHATNSAEALSIAMGFARQQVTDLRRDAILTGTTFEELAKTFETTVAAGLEHGLNINQIREFTRQVTIAGQALGQEQGRISAQAREILTGAITARQAIPSALGITNNDIKNAKDAGQLFEFLESKFKAFNAVAGQNTQTIRGLFNQLKGGFQLLILGGTGGFFGDLKKLIESVRDSIITINAGLGTITVNPEAVQVVEILSKGLGSVVNQVKAIGSAFKIGDIQAIASALSTLLELGATVISGIVQGAVTGATGVLNVLNTIRVLLRSLTGFDFFNSPLIRQTLSNLVAMGAAIVTVNLITLTLTYGWKLLLFNISGFLGFVKALTPALALVLRGLEACGVSSTFLNGSLLPVVGTVGALAAAFAAVLFLVDQFRSKPLLDIKNSKPMIEFIGLIFKAKLGIQSLFGDPANKKDQEDFLATMQLIADLEKEASAAPTVGQTFDNAKIEAIKSFKNLLVDTGLAATSASSSTEGFIKAQSEAITALEQKIKGLQDAAHQARDASLASLAAVGTPGSGGQAIQAQAASRLKSQREINELINEQNLALKQEAFITQGLEGGLFTSEKEINDALAQREAIRQRIEALSKAEWLNAQINQRIVSAELLTISAQAAEEERRANATLAVEAANARSLRVLQQRGDFQALAVVQAQQALDIAIKQDRLQEQDLIRQLAAKQAALDLARNLQTGFNRNPLPSDASEHQIRDRQEEVDLNNKLVDASGRDVAELQKQLGLVQTINREKEAGLATQLQLNEFAQQSPIGTGVVEAAARSFQALSDRFQTTINIMTSAVQGFSQFAAQSIVSAFDPTSNQTIQERFARFLQQLAEQIIATLIEIAITAEILNIASSGILGATLQGFAQARTGRFDGGAVGRHDGGRVRRTARHRAGFNEGGSPMEFARHGFSRPAGLHPSDTVPIWADPTEWVIRGSEVGRAGADALDRINRGLYDPYALRAAVGLRASRGGVMTSPRGMGRAGGGQVGGPSPSGGQPQGSGVGVSVIVPSEKSVDSFLRGGTPALLRVLADNGIFPRK